MDETLKALEMLTMVSLYSRNHVGTSVKTVRIKDTDFWLITILFDEKEYYFHISDMTFMTRPIGTISRGLVDKVEELSKIRSAV